MLQTLSVTILIKYELVWWSAEPRLNLDLDRQAQK